MNRTEAAKRLLRSMSEIDERYIMEAAAAPVRKAAPRRTMRIALAAAACLALVLVAKNVTELGIGNSDTPNVQIANPIEEVSDMDEAAEITGFALEVPQMSENYGEGVITVIDGSLIEIGYPLAESAEEGVYGCTIRKAAGTEDVSGDYETYEREWSVTVDGRSVTLKGNGDTVSLAVWTDGGYSYAVGTQNAPISEAEMEALVAATQ